MDIYEYLKNGGSADALATEIKNAQTKIAKEKAEAEEAAKKAKQAEAANDKILETLRNDMVSAVIAYFNRVVPQITINEDDITDIIELIKTYEAIFKTLETSKKTTTIKTTKKLSDDEILDNFIKTLMK